MVLRANWIDRAKVSGPVEEGKRQISAEEGRVEKKEKEAFFKAVLSSIVATCGY